MRGILPPLLYFRSAGFLICHFCFKFFFISPFHFDQIDLAMPILWITPGSSSNERHNFKRFQRVTKIDPKRMRVFPKDFQGIPLQRMDDGHRRCALHQDWSPGGFDMYISMIPMRILQFPKVLQTRSCDNLPDASVIF